MFIEYFLSAYFCLFKCGTSSLSAVYKEFTEVLLKCNRYDECLIVCEKILSEERGKNKYYSLKSVPHEKYTVTCKHTKISQRSGIEMK